MPRRPEPNSKSVQLILRAKPGQEEKIRWFKNWCLINGESYSTILYQKVEEWGELHGFPDGHSQTTLSQVTSGKIKTLVPRWKTCKYSNKKMWHGEFVCNGSTKIPRACPQCNRYKLEVKKKK